MGWDSATTSALVPHDYGDAEQERTRDAAREKLRKKLTRVACHGSMRFDTNDLLWTSPKRDCFHTARPRCTMT